MGCMTQRKLYEASYLIGALFIVMGVAVGLGMQSSGSVFAGLTVLIVLACIGVASVVQGYLGLRRDSPAQETVSGPNPVVIAIGVGIVAALIPVVYHLKYGLGSAAGIGIIVGAALIVAASIYCAVRWSRTPARRP